MQLENFPDFQKDDMRRKSQSGIQIKWNSEMNFGQIHCKGATIILFFFLHPHSFKCDFEVPSVKGRVSFSTPSIWAELVTYFQQQNAATVVLYMYTCALHIAAPSQNSAQPPCEQAYTGLEDGKPCGTETSHSNWSHSGPANQLRSFWTSCLQIFEWAPRDQTTSPAQNFVSEVNNCCLKPLDFWGYL